MISPTYFATSAIARGGRNTPTRNDFQLRTDRGHSWHAACTRTGVVGLRKPGWVGSPDSVRAALAQSNHHPEGTAMKWTKPEAEVVAVTLEVTAYVATL